MPSWSLLFPDWPHPASPASIPRPGRRLCRGERDTRPPALPAGWCQVFTWGELSAGAWFPELAAGTGHAPPRAPPRWGMAVGPSPSGAASVTCGPQHSIQGLHLRMEGIQEAAWEKEREDAFVGPGSSERPELRAAARGRGWRVGGTARGRDGACPASGQGRRRPLLRAGARGAPFPGGFSKRPVSRGGGEEDGADRHTRALPLLAFAGRSGARGVSCAVEPVGTAAVAGPARARRAGRRGQEVRGTVARPRVIHKTGDRPAVPSACKGPSVDCPSPTSRSLLR